MKNGTAISGKLSAPLMMFCATIWESNMSRKCIKAMPQTIRANAIGMPSAMAPRSETVKTTIVMVQSGREQGLRSSAVPVAFLHSNKVLAARRADDDLEEVVSEDGGRRDAEDEPG